MKMTSLLFALMCTTAAATSDPRAPGRGNPGRPVILLVHGRGSISRDSAVFRRTALQALRAGAFRATGDSLFDDEDVRVVWYADLMATRRGTRTSALCERNDDISYVGISPGFFLRSLALIVSELVDVGARDSVAGDARDIAGDLRFIGDPSLQCDAEGRVERAVARAHDEDRPIVVVAHSLGALVTWGYLQHRGTLDAHDVVEIQRLVTLGSPIGHGELRELLFGDTSGVSLPRGVRSWVNAVNPDDPFASRLMAMDSAHAPVRALRGIADVVTGQSDEPAHDLRGYLRDPVAAETIVRAWCDAAEMRRRFAGCVAVTKR